MLIAQVDFIRLVDSQCYRAFYDWTIHSKALRIAAMLAVGLQTFTLTRLGLSLDDYTKTDSMRDVANAFRLALHNNKHGFTKQDTATSYDVVLLGKIKSHTLRIVL